MNELAMILYRLNLIAHQND